MCRIMVIDEIRYVFIVVFWVFCLKGGGLSWVEFS